MSSQSCTLGLLLRLLVTVSLLDHEVHAVGPGMALMRTTQGPVLRHDEEAISLNSNFTSYGRFSSLRQMLYNSATSDEQDGGDTKEIWINYDEPRGGRVCYRARPSDKLKFYWDEYHNLKELKDANSYNSCDFNGATNHQSEGEPNSGKFITL